MLEVVFHDSIKGAMSMAKKKAESKLIGQGSLLNNIKSEPNKLFDSSTDIVLDGDAEGIVNIGFSLDIGDISGSILSTERQKLFASIFNTLNETELEQFFQMQLMDLEKLMLAAKIGTRIRVWHSNAPFSACGLAFVCDKLKDTNCEIHVVALPLYHKNRVGMVSYEDWIEVPPWDFGNFLSYEKKLSDQEKSIYAAVWQKLKQENSPLRAIVNGKLMSVPETFYDFLILDHIPDNEFTIGQLIGTIMAKYQLGVSDGWYALRIRKMIQENKLLIIADQCHQNPYNIILKKVR